MREERGEYTVGLMIVAGRKQTDAVLTARRKNRMRQRNFGMVEDDHRDVFEGNAGGLLLFDDEREMLALELRGIGNDVATPNHAEPQIVQDIYYQERRRRTYRRRERSLARCFELVPRFLFGDSDHAPTG